MTIAMAKASLPLAAALMRCTIDQARAQYARNAEGFREMAARARKSKTGKSNGYAVEYLESRAVFYDAVAAGPANAVYTANGERT